MSDDPKDDVDDLIDELLFGSRTPQPALPVYGESPLARVLGAARDMVDFEAAERGRRLFVGAPGRLGALAAFAAFFPPILPPIRLPLGSVGIVDITVDGLDFEPGEFLTIKPSPFDWDRVERETEHWLHRSPARYRRRHMPKAGWRDRRAQRRWDRKQRRARTRGRGPSIVWFNSNPFRFADMVAALTPERVYP